MRGEEKRKGKVGEWEREGEEGRRGRGREGEGGGQMTISTFTTLDDIGEKQTQAFLVEASPKQNKWIFYWHNDVCLR